MPPSSCVVDVFGDGASMVVISQPPHKDEGCMPWGCLDAVGELTALAYEGSGVRLTVPSSLDEVPVRRLAACATLRKRFGAVVFVVDGGVPRWILEKVTYSFGWPLEQLSSYHHGEDTSPPTCGGGSVVGAAAGVSGVFYVPPGEGSKCRDMKASIEDWMLQLGSYQSPDDDGITPFHCGRDTLMVAVGGGVVGDLAGFVASTFMRGVDVVQVPTTLMAMVDSSVGGKTAINVPGIGKNLIGSFHQPRLIAMDVRCLTTLPHRVLLEAVGEVIKYEMIGVTLTPGGDTVANIVGARYTHLVGDTSGDKRLIDSPLAVSGLIPLEGLFEACQPTSADPPTSHTTSCLPLWFHIVILSVLSKQYFVAGDAKEVKGLREVLNFGHTIGHAIEGCASEGGAEGLLHGECVAAGMVHEVELALMVPPSDAAVPPTTFLSLWRLRWILRRCGLPDSVEECRRRVGEPSSLPVSALERYMLQDKKNRVGRVHVVLLGQCRSSAVPLSMVRTVCGADYLMDTSVPYTPVEDVPMVGSKSITNRALILGCQLPLIGGPSHVVLEDALLSDDTLLLYCALVELGLVSRRDHLKGLAFSVPANVHHVVTPAHTMDPISVYVGNSGTTARFLLGLLAFTNPSRIRGGSRQVLLHGTSRMHERPIGDLVDALRVGLSTLVVGGTPTLEYIGREGCLPIRITLAPSMTFKDGGVEEVVRLSVNSTQSSQFQSSLLLATPSLLHRAGEGVRVVVEGGSEVGEGGTPTVVSGGYIHMSAHMLGQFGASIRAVPDEERHGSSLRLAYEVRLPPPSTPDANRSTSFVYPVEPDMSATSNFYALAGGMCLLDGTAVVPATCVHLQSDNDFPTMVVAPIVHIVRTGGDLTLDMEAYTDSFIAASALAVFGGLWCTYCNPDERNDWSIRLVNIANQRVKECDRLAATVRELGKVCLIWGGRVSISELSDGIHVVFSSTAPILSFPIPATPSCQIDTYDDHRVAMAASVLGVLYSCLPDGPVVPMVIRDFRCVEKTFPSFFNFIKK